MMKNQDRFGYVIYDSVFKKMVEYANKLEEIGFQESYTKPNLLYYKDYFSTIFAVVAPIGLSLLSPAMIIIGSGISAIVLGLTYMAKKIKVKVQQTLQGKSLLPLKAERIISRDYKGKSKHTRQFMQDLWKLQKLSNKFVFGMIYRWKNKNTGKLYIGRTQRYRGTHYYRPFSPMSIRFQEEIEKAIYGNLQKLKKARNQFYYDMRVVYESAGRGQDGMDAIQDTFELEIVEIQLMGDNYNRDSAILIHLEDYWIDSLKQQGEDLYNVGSGATGAVASYEGSAYGKKDLYEKVIELLSHGFTSAEIARYIDIGEGLMRSIIKDATGMTSTKAHLTYVGERMFDLMDNGILDLPSLASYFKGMDANDVLVFLASKNNRIGNEFLKGLITSEYLKQGSRDRLEDYLLDLGVSFSSVRGSGSFYKFRIREDLFGYYQRDDYIPLLKFYATFVIKHSRNRDDFLARLGLLEEELVSWERDLLVVDIFGIDFDTAKDLYSDHYFGHLQILIR